MTLTKSRAVSGEASYDNRRKYRYRLTRIWDRTGPEICWVLLNPSTATALVDDPTITRISAFSRGWGFGRAVVVNLFAMRSKHPTDLRCCHDPVGPHNDATISVATESAELVLVAWGNHGSLANPRTSTPRCREVVATLSDVETWCLGVTATGQPRHPLYLPGTTDLEPFHHPALVS